MTQEQLLAFRKAMTDYAGLYLSQYKTKCVFYIGATAMSPDDVDVYTEEILGGNSPFDADTRDLSLTLVRAVLATCHSFIGDE